MLVFDLMREIANTVQRKSYLLEHRVGLSKVQPDELKVKALTNFRIFAELHRGTNYT